MTYAILFGLLTVAVAIYFGAEVIAETLRNQATARAIADG